MKSHSSISDCICLALVRSDKRISFAPAGLPRPADAAVVQADADFPFLQFGVLAQLADDRSIRLRIAEQTGAHFAGQSQFDICIVIGGRRERTRNRAKHQVVVGVAAVGHEWVEIDPVAPLANACACVDMRENGDIHVVFHHAAEDLAQLGLHLVAHGVVERRVIAGAIRAAEAFDFQFLGQVDQDRDDNIEAALAAGGSFIDRGERFSDWPADIDEYRRVKLSCFFRLRLSFRRQQLRRGRIRFRPVTVRQFWVWMRRQWAMIHLGAMRKYVAFPFSAFPMNKIGRRVAINRLA